MSLLSMTLAGAVMIVMVILLRALALHTLPKRLFLVLWGLVLLRLLVPFSLPMPWKLDTPAWLWPVQAAVPAPLAGSVSFAQMPGNLGSTVASVSAADTALAGDSVSGSAPGAAAAFPWRLLYLGGCVVCGAFYAFTYLKCRREFRESLPVEDGFAEAWLEAHPLRRRLAIRQLDRISTPLTYGFLRPVILLPKAMDWNDREALRFVLEHEYMHICHLDAVGKLLLIAAACVHWFNPLVWVMVVLCGRDMELCCDEAVLRQLGLQSKAAYATALLRMESARSGFRPLCSSFCKNALEERIVAMMKGKKTSVAALVAAVLLTVSMTTAFAAPAKGEDAPSPAEPNRQTNAQTIHTAETLCAYRNPEDGKTYYSWDEGKTWVPMTDEEFNTRYTENAVDWWTAEEYAAWLENEKKELQTIIGSKGWTPSTGWFTWTQERVDETIRKYEETLRDIEENGVKVSKMVYDEYGNPTQYMVSYNPDDVVLGQMINDTAVDGGWQEFLPEPELPETELHEATRDYMANITVRKDNEDGTYTETTDQYAIATVKYTYYLQRYENGGYVGGHCDDEIPPQLTFLEPLPGAAVSGKLQQQPVKYGFSGRGDTYQVLISGGYFTVTYPSFLHYDCNGQLVGARETTEDRAFYYDSDDDLKP